MLPRLIRLLSFYEWFFCVKVIHLMGVTLIDYKILILLMYFEKFMGENHYESTNKTQTLL